MRISDLSSDVCSSDLARVTGLRIANFEMADDSFDKVAAEIAALPGRTGFLVAKLDGGTVKPIASAHSDEQFAVGSRSEEHTSELQSLMRISYAVFCLKQNKH